MQVALVPPTRPPAAPARPKTTIPKACATTEIRLRPVSPPAEPAPPADPAPVVPSGAIPVESVFLRLDEEIDVPARESGVLAEMPAAEGQLVAKGDLLARIEDDQAELVRERTAFEVEIAKRQADKSIEIEYAAGALAVALAEFNRAERSRAQLAGSVSATDYERLRLEAQKADAERRRIIKEQETAGITAAYKASELKLAALRLAHHRAVAPIDGLVVEHYKQPGEWVEPGQSVLRLVRLDLLRAEGYLDAAYLSGDLHGRPVSLTVEFPGRPEMRFAGKVVFVAPEVEPTTGQILVRAAIANTGLTLRPGLRARMTIDPRPENAAEPGGIEASDAADGEENAAPGRLTRD